MLRAEADSQDLRSTNSAILGQHLAALGFEQRWGFGAVNWHGRHQGRPTILTISRQSRTRYQGQLRRRQHFGWRLRIQMDCAVPTRLFFVKSTLSKSKLIRWIYRKKGQRVIEQLPAVLEGFQVVTRDPDWAGPLLTDTTLMIKIAALLTERSTEALRGSVYFQPGQLLYGSGTLQAADLGPQWIESILERMNQIAASAEALPEPTIKEKPSRFERYARKHPLRTAGLIMLGLLTTLTVLFTFGLAMMMLLAWIF